ncbi:MAG: FtsQ-type POTRA domain-containing protein [Myxococcota bacterium]|nr:FtsQ-type POTRA domain-containing protein [Myxococcota bacterium]
MQTKEEAAKNSKLTAFRKTWLPIIISGVSVSAAILIAFYGWSALRESEQLRVKSLQVIGNASISTEEITSYAGLALGQSIFEIDLDAVSRNLKRHPWIDKAYVRRRLPDVIRIHVGEHQPRLLVALEHVYLADEEGNVFKRWQGEDVKGLPVITGLNAEEAKDFPETTREHLLMAISLADTISAEPGVLTGVDEIAYDKDLGWSILSGVAGTRGRPVRMHLGLDPESQLHLLHAVLSRLQEINRLPEVVWVDQSKHLNKIHVRLNSTYKFWNKQTILAKAR